MYRTTMY